MLSIFLMRPQKIHVVGDRLFFHGLWARSLLPNSLALHFIHGPDLPANEGLFPLLVDQPSILGSMIYRHLAQSLIYWWGPCIVALSCSSTFVRYSVGRNATKNVPIQLWIFILLAIHQLWACPERTTLSVATSYVSDSCQRCSHFSVNIDCLSRAKTMKF